MKCIHSAKGTSAFLGGEGLGVFPNFTLEVWVSLNTPPTHKHMHICTPTPTPEVKIQGSQGRHRGGGSRGTNLGINVGAQKNSLCTWRVATPLGWPLVPIQGCGPADAFFLPFSGGGVPNPFEGGGVENVPGQDSFDQTQGRGPMCYKHSPKEAVRRIFRQSHSQTKMTSPKSSYPGR